ncbi:uncharacterized protein LOC101899533 [Musca domestica]|uniref:Uncharacterized protein LOC101899533 n=1 Tax=Musca domestica TaxID=7370 RepID=A0A1I8N078_MUSDO|nr:uncharacterized protein LOC101899533 [Musca domestica]
MVVGPFAQGIFLMGIIYWYSKGLMNLINDYYRSEFNRKLKTSAVDQKSYDMKRDIYDLDDMDELIRLERLKDMERQMANGKQVVGDIVEPIEECTDSEYKGTCENEGFFNDSRQCYYPNLKNLFLNILLQFEDCHLNSREKYTIINYPMCMLNEGVT